MIINYFVFKFMKIDINVEMGSSKESTFSFESGLNIGGINTSSLGQQQQQKNRLTITSTRVCREELKLPKGVAVVSADSAAADLSSSSMFTHGQVPYLFSTACSDGKLFHFFYCSYLN